MQEISVAAIVVLVTGLAACSADGSSSKPFTLDSGSDYRPMLTGARIPVPIAAEQPRLNPPPASGVDASMTDVPDAPGSKPWRVRLIGGVGIATGDDAPDSEGQLAMDVGRVLPGGVEVDIFWRTQRAPFDREPNGTDCGVIYFLGAKASGEWPLASSRYYAWGGLGAGAFWTDSYIDNDSGFGVMGEGGLGYVLSANARLRLGVGLQGIDSEVGRNDPADDGSSRWLLIFAPALQLEFHF